MQEPIYLEERDSDSPFYWSPLDEEGYEDDLAETELSNDEMVSLFDIIYRR